MTWNFVWIYYERAKAKLFGYVARFMLLRNELMGMRFRIGRVYDKARKVSDQGGMTAANRLRGQIDEAYQKQGELEQRLINVQGKIGMLDKAKAGDTEGVDFAISITAVLAAVAVIGSVAAAIIIHTQRVGYLNRLLDEIERKVLTPAEATALRGDGFSLTGGAGNLAMIGAVAVGAYFLLGRGVRPTSRRRR